jgi:threonine dehydratase
MNSSLRIPTADDVLAARRRITPHIIRTPMLRNAQLDHLTGGTILLKPEVLQRTGAFKLRGATNALRSLAPEALQRGVVTYSSGNHGQAIACAAQSLGVAATIVMPANAPAIKRQSTERWGAQIIAYDRASENREAIAAEITARTGATLIPPYEHADVIAGQGTLALELADDAKAAGLQMDALLVCTGGGGLISGCALGLSAVSPGTKIYCVEPAGWDDTARSLKSGNREKNDGTGSTFCDALLTPTPGELTFSINRNLLAGGRAVTDQQVVAAMKFAAASLKLVLEPGGAVALAALLAGTFDARGLTVGIVLSGGNIDLADLARVLNSP